MSNPWFRMYHEFATDPKIQMLSELNQRRYVMLLCLRCCNDDVTLQDSQVAFQLRINVDEWAKTKALFLEQKLVTKDNKPTSWDKRQFISDSSTARVARHRQSKKNKCNVTCNNNVTKSNVVDTDTDTDTDTDKEKIYTSSPKVNNSVPFKEIVELFHKTLPELSKVEKLTATRKGYIRQRWIEDLPDLDHWENYFKYIRLSDFLMGKTQQQDRRPFRCSLEWLTKPANFAKVSEENYHG